MPAGKQYYRQTNWPVVITRSTDEKKKKDLQHFYIERDSRYKKKRVPIKVTQWPSKKWCSEISHPYHSSSSIDDRRRKNYDTLTLNAIRVSNLSESHYCMTKQKVVQWNLILVEMVIFSFNSPALKQFYWWQTQRNLWCVNISNDLCVRGGWRDALKDPAVRFEVQHSGGLAFRPLPYNVYRVQRPKLQQRICIVSTDQELSIGLWCFDDIISGGSWKQTWRRGGSLLSELFLNFDIFLSSMHWLYIRHIWLKIFQLQLLPHNSDRHVYEPIFGQIGKFDAQISFAVNSALESYFFFGHGLFALLG